MGFLEKSFIFAAAKVAARAARHNPYLWGINTGAAENGAEGEGITEEMMRNGTFWDEIFDYIKDNYKGVIVECFGVGGAPDGYSHIAGKLIELAHSGIAVVITTQCLYEGIDINIYQVGESLSDVSLILGGKMTTEALTMKLMWALAHYDSIKDVKAYIEQS